MSDSEYGHSKSQDKHLEAQGKPVAKPALSLDFMIGEFKAEDMLVTLIRECSKRGYWVAGIVLDPEHKVEPKLYGTGTPDIIKTLLLKGADLIGRGTVIESKQIPNKVN